MSGWERSDKGKHDITMWMWWQRILCIRRYCGDGLVSIPEQRPWQRTAICLHAHYPHSCMNDWLYSLCGCQVGGIYLSWMCRLIMSNVVCRCTAASLQEKENCLSSAENQKPCGYLVWAGCRMRLTHYSPCVWTDLAAKCNAGVEWVWQNS